MRISDWSSDVCSSDLRGKAIRFRGDDVRAFQSRNSTGVRGIRLASEGDEVISLSILHRGGMQDQQEREDYLRFAPWKAEKERSEEHTSELQSLMRISYAVVCLKKKRTKN